jgi:hypothetical protein
VALSRRQQPGAREARPWEKWGRKLWQAKDVLRPVDIIDRLMEKIIKGYTHLGP